MGRLAGRVAIVTGAGRGIGAAVAEAFAAEGASVVVNDLGSKMEGGDADAEPAREVVERILAAGGRASVNLCDVTDFEKTRALVGQAIDDFGRLDILVNAHGILRDGMIFKMSEDQWDVVIDVHLKGTFNTTRHASAWWREHRGGQFRLINFVSGSGLYGAPAQPNYAAAKMGILGFTLSCANALRDYGVTSNCIAPTAYTRMTASLEGKPTVNRYSADNPRISAANVVPPLVLLAMEETDWINGRVIESGNGRIGLVSNPAPERQLVTPGLWDLDFAIDEMQVAFKEALNPNPFSGPRAS